MKDELKEVYLSNLEWDKTHDNIGGVMCNLIFKDNMSYEDYQKLFKTTYFILCDKDYITNLQEENEYFNHCDEEKRKTITNLRYKIERLEEDNKQLKELCDKYEEEHSTKFNEWVFDKRENERLKQIIKDNTILVKDENGNYQECNINPLDYKSRNEKAILFIDNYLKIIDNSDINMQIVKDILQGDDKE